MAEKDFNQIPANVLYGKRLIIFLEEEPHSDIYRQICLTEDELKKVNKNIGKVIETKGDIETVDLCLSEETYLLPDLREVYPDNQ